MKIDKEFWQSKRGKALIKLGIWVGVFALVMLSTFFLPQENNSADKAEEITYEDIMKEFVDSDYMFEYDINVNGISYYYEGIRLGDVVSGYKTLNDNIIKYVIEDDLDYQVTSSGNLVMEDLYLGLNETFLDVELLDEYLSSLEYVEKEEYVYEFDDVDYEIVLVVDRRSGVKIEISNEMERYKLYFSNINNIYKVGK